jgi:hypothetical protein
MTTSPDQERTPSATPLGPVRGLIGPFTARNLAALGGTLGVAGVLLLLLTSPEREPGRALGAATGCEIEGFAAPKYQQARASQYTPFGRSGEIGRSILCIVRRVGRVPARPIRHPRRGHLPRRRPCGHVRVALDLAWATAPVGSRPSRLPDGQVPSRIPASSSRRRAALPALNRTIHGTSSRRGRGVSSQDPSRHDRPLQCHTQLEDAAGPGGPAD